MIGAGLQSFRRKEEVILYEDFNGLTNVGTQSSGPTFARRATGVGTGDNMPVGWQSSVSGNSDQITLFGSTTETSLANNRGWVMSRGNTASAGTGPCGPMLLSASGPDLHTSSTGEWHTTNADGVTHSQNGIAGQHYMFYESSNPAGVSSAAHAIRTKAFDVEKYQTVTLSFWFHAHGANFGGTTNSSTRGLGIACTTSATSASSAVEAGTGLGFTSDTAGGGYINYQSHTASPNTQTMAGPLISLQRLTALGPVQTDGDDSDLAVANHWIRATVDLSAAAGNTDDVYIYFAYFSHVAGSGFTQDLAIDNVLVTGLT
tara:strand:- start:241 stop:1191 length:951 start_codon:yes stop_codon:yes gene_type:complete